MFDAVEAAQVVVVVPRRSSPRPRRSRARAAGAASGYLTVVAGGETRQASVAAGLAVARSPGSTVVLVHDAARALTPGSLFDRVISAVRTGGADGGGVIPALPVSDTIKRIDRREKVVATVNRNDLVHVQTPQGFPRAALDAAYAPAAKEHTDDAALFQDAGGAVSIVEGEARAFKITTPWDLRRAENVLGIASGIRTGLGVDVHAYDDSAPLWLGGVYWPDEPGLAGHSDGDVVIHAICDALLSAAGLGDMGTRFGSDEPAVRGGEERDVPARDADARHRLGVRGRQRRGAGHRQASADRSAARRGRDPADRPRRSAGERLRDDDRRARVHGTWRGDHRDRPRHHHRELTTRLRARAPAAQHDDRGHDGSGEQHRDDRPDQPGRDPASVGVDGRSRSSRPVRRSSHAATGSVSVTGSSASPAG